MIKNKINIIKIKMMDKDFLTIWMNNLLVIYAFLLPISQTIKSTVFVLILLLFFIRGNIVHHLKIAWKNNVVRAFVYLFTIYLIGLSWTDDISLGIRALKSIKYGLYLILFYILIDGRYIEKVITAFILGMLISELTSYGIILGILPWKLIIMDVHFYSAPSLYDPSPFLNHIHYGVALSFVVLLLGQKIFYNNSPLYLKLFMSIFVITATANVFITGGRTGYVSFLLLIMILGIFYLKRYAILAFVFLSLVFSIAYTSSPIFKAKVLKTEKSISNLFSDKPNFNTSVGTRAGMFYFGLKAIKEQPIFGVGTGGTMLAIKENTPKKWKGIHRQPHAHNQFLSILISLGIVGLLVFLNIYYQIFTYKQEDKELRFIMIFSTLAITFGILTTQFNLRFFMPLWVVMLSITLINKNRTTIKQKINEKKELINITLALSILSSTYLLKQLF